MFRRVSLIWSAVIACVAITTICFVLWRPVTPPSEPGSTEPAPPADASAATGAAPLVEPAVAPLAPTAHANVIVSIPQEDPALASVLSATAVSVNIDQADVDGALLALSEAAQIAINPPRGRRLPGADAPSISVHLQDQPFLEALLQIEAQGFFSVSMTPGQPWSAQLGVRRTLPGVWSVAGPFAFALTSISHGVMLDREGQPVPVRGGGPTDPVVLQMTALFEPKLHVLRYPMQVTLLEVTDDRGHSLIPAMRDTRFDQATNINFPLRATLAYPAQDAGRLIKTFRGTATYALQLAATTVTIDDPLNAPPAERNINGIAASFGTCTWNDARQVLEMTATYRRGSFVGDWASTAQGLAGIKPRVPPNPGKPAPVDGSNATIAGDVVMARYALAYPLMIPPGGRVPQPQGAPMPESISLDVPVGTAQVAVPVEFKDIPLP